MAPRTSEFFLELICALLFYAGTMAQVIRYNVCQGLVGRPLNGFLICHCYDELGASPPKWYGPRAYLQDNTSRLIMNASSMPRQPDGSDSRIVTSAVFRNETVLSISHLTFEDAGVYTCIVDTRGSTNASLQLYVYEPLVVTAPAEQFYLINESSRLLICKATGTAASIILWRKNEQYLDTRGGKYLQAEDGLIVYNPTISDIGEYKCIGQQTLPTAGDTKQASFNVSAYMIPKILFPRHNGTVITAYTTNASVEIRCEAIGYPRPRYFFRFWDFTSWFTADQNYGTRFTPNYDTGLLQIIELQTWDSAIFTCEAKNAAGADKIYIELKVLPPPLTTESEMNTTFDALGTDADGATSAIAVTSSKGDISHRAGDELSSRVQGTRVSVVGTAAVTVVGTPVTVSEVRATAKIAVNSTSIFGRTDGLVVEDEEGTVTNRSPTANVTPGRSTDSELRFNDRSTTLRPPSSFQTASDNIIAMPNQTFSTLPAITPADAASPGKTSVTFSTVSELPKTSGGAFRYNLTKGAQPAVATLVNVASTGATTPRGISTGSISVKETAKPTDRINFRESTTFSIGITNSALPEFKKISPTTSRIETMTFQDIQENTSLVNVLARSITLNAGTVATKSTASAASFTVATGTTTSATGTTARLPLTTTTAAGAGVVASKTTSKTLSTPTNDYSPWDQKSRALRQRLPPVLLSFCIAFSALNR